MTPSADEPSIAGPSADGPSADGDFRRKLRVAAGEFAQLRRSFKRRLGVLAPLYITLYGGYGSNTSVVLRGRVLEARAPTAPKLGDRRYSNFKRAFALIESDEVPGVKLEVSAEGAAQTVTSDEDGYFHVRLSFPSPVPHGWLHVAARVTDTPYPVSQMPKAEVSVLVPPATARFGVISDIDDTILRTYVRNRAKMVYLTLLKNPLTRRPFEGTTELYQGLLAGGQDAPFFYVSQSMWNIFPLLESFIDHQKLPRGPLLLRQVGLLAPRRKPPHKASAIAELLNTYPELPFVLIGDSGQRDLEIYLAAARQHPGRVLSILIRNVSPIKRRQALQAMAQKDAPPGCPVLVFDDSKQAAEHCRELGLWSPPAMVAAPVAPAQMSQP